MSKGSLRNQLLALARQHPNWTDLELGQHLGQSKDTVRAALSIFRRKGLLKPKPKKVIDPKRQHAKKPAPPKEPAPVEVRQTVSLAGRAYGRQTGYFKLL